MKLLKSRLVLGVFAAILILVLFNWNREPLESKKQAEFRAWYETTVPPLSSEHSTPQAISNLKVRVKFQRDANTSLDYTLPGSLGDVAVETERLARILQLIRESQIFSIDPTAPVEGIPHLTVSITDSGKSFETTVPFETIEHNIQLQNLLKLLELFGSSATNRDAINPARL